VPNADAAPNADAGLGVGNFRITLGTSGTGKCAAINF
jgi:hypothetical protein